MSSKCSQCQLKLLENETKLQNLNFDIFKGFLIWQQNYAIRQICELSLNLAKAQM